jgi:SpoVK/Ycf46/Vps4 family AAA+-type ATPase
LQTSTLADLTEGFSGAEIVSICRESALLAIEESDQNPDIAPMIGMRHVQKSISGTKKQITPSMLEFYDSFGKSKNAMES